MCVSMLQTLCCTTPICTLTYTWFGVRVYMYWCQVGLHTTYSLDPYIVQDYYWNISPDNFLLHVQPCMTWLYLR